jgi:hypothetical protein
MELLGFAKSAQPNLQLTGVFKIQDIQTKLCKIKKMKKSVIRLTDTELKAYPIKDLIDGWYFRVDEISQGYYRVTGIDQWGRSVSRDGKDPDELLLLGKKDIIEMVFGRIE